ncbi:LAFE_0H15192g1_1 [Lachancea fermentati]|uniref:Spindle pole body component SPC42 n=1 Tax=Lachancea fermentati TaxID=4955 RepID=A0A1G4MKW6_LACFM|nr:LAFE_0H15192g1_1 [Lachancea fermentati]
MNISPTPRRYNSRGHDYGSRVDDEPAFHPFNRAPPAPSADRIVPEEYRVNSQMINKLIKQNKQLTAQLEHKQDEIDRLNVLVGSLRGKLIKYTELNKKLSSAPAASPASSSSPAASPDVLQVNKTRSGAARAAPALEDRVSDIYTKLDALTRLVAGERAPDDPPRVRTPHLRSASEDDILTQESAELKQLEDQIDLLKRKLLIKRENELRKLSLNKELLDLMEKLDVSGSSSSPQPPPPAAPAPAPVPAPNSHLQASPHCTQCHNAAAPAPASTRPAPSYMSMAQALETPSPAPKNVRPTDTLW